ncbi:MAG: peptidoglycan editing factor PgeF [Desulforhopalus sp.]
MMTTALHPQLFGEFPATAGVVCHYGMFNRHDGVSEGLFESRNIGRNVGDREDAVVKNRQRVKEEMGIDFLLSADQVHGTDIFSLAEPPSGDIQGGKADALVTDVPGVGLMIQQADCQAVLLFDPVRQAIAAVHCGWRGSVKAILPRVIGFMQEKYGTVPADLCAVISPSLGPCCGEFINHKKELPPEFMEFMVRDNHFDFWRISNYQLVSCGMIVERIQTAAVCTCCSDDYFSYRRAIKQSGGVTGRNCSVISLRRV